LWRIKLVILHLRKGQTKLEWLKENWRQNTRKLKYLNSAYDRRVHARVYWSNSDADLAREKRLYEDVNV